MCVFVSACVRSARLLAALHDEHERVLNPLQTEPRPRGQLVHPQERKHELRSQAPALAALTALTAAAAAAAAGGGGRGGRAFQRRSAAGALLALELGAVPHELEAHGRGPSSASSDAASGGGVSGGGVVGPDRGCTVVCREEDDAGGGAVLGATLVEELI